MGNERPRYWFPLALLGFAQLAAVVADRGRSPDGGWFAYTPYGTGAQWMTTEQWAGSRAYESALAISTEASTSRNDFWLFAVLAAFLGTVIWYAVRARRAGNGPRWWKVAALAVGGVAGVVLADLVVFWEIGLDGDLRTALLITVGLLVLAWWEQSKVPLILAALFGLAGWLVADGTNAMLLSAMAALTGAFAALVRRPKAAAEGS